MAGPHLRIPCVVPFCRRGSTHFPDGEIICGRHWRLADRCLRRLYTKALRREKHALCRLIWERARRQVIERAAMAPF